ncbi:MAG TPA: Rv3654c family TadE-like protein [Actinomycetota bacterium]|nr:Rv3654c family TadE-like protein [Actinomycetota bacterium]
MMPAVRTDDRGNAAIALVGGVAMVMVFALGVTDLAVYFLARTRAQTAADSAALAAAAELIPGLGAEPEAKAREFANANGARLLRCTCELGSDVAEVSVAVPVPRSLLGLSNFGEVNARSRAEVSSPPSAG